MKLVKKILNKFNGLHYSQEYLCFAASSFEQPLHVYLVNDNHIIKDITNQHLFVGYSPLVFAFPEMELPEMIQLIFNQQLFEPNESFSKKDAFASLDLKMIKQNSPGNKVLYYEGTNGRHRFLSRFHQFINRINNNLYNKKPGNVFLHNNLYNQVQIAYAVPRNISLITICHNDLFNLFPTDLHGQVDNEHYIISLRIGGKACGQVEAADKLVLSKIHADAYKTAFALGKNHMQELRSKDNFPFSQSSSATFQWPLPQHAVSYKELTLVDSFTHGIHKILLFKIVSGQQIQPEPAVLAHIHTSYATWRYKNDLPGNYLLR